LRINAILNKSFMTNFISGLLVVAGYFSPECVKQQIISVGLFAVSGAITNWLAIFMLFEKVPGLYGSGVIPARFEDFKKGIYNLIMGQFFTVENLQKFFDEEASDKDIGIAQFILDLDMDKAFDSLVKVITESPFGGMLAMFGGEAALLPLKEPFSKKIKETLVDLTNNETVKSKITEMVKKQTNHEVLIEKVSVIVRKRLDELTPQMVKEIIQEMIRQHLGWLVVWGGVFGGLIGLITSFL